MKDLKLNELTLENMGQWPLLAKVGLIIFINLVIIGLGYWFLIKGNFETYDTLKAQEQTLRMEFETKQRQAASLIPYKLQLQEMAEKFGNMLRQLPTQNEMPGLLEDISKTGVASGLTFQLFAPMPEVEHDFYVELPIKIAVLGNYHQIAVFISRVVEMSRIVTLHDFVIEGAPKEKDKPTPPGELIMKMTAKIYRYRTQ
ncbi:Tfp pilus assembly protein PilO [Legionella adelaidensis]|uniref:Tfp pilus assembly protein PilO n=1 Tax=Legionella adelaidensis TaxID=45056 RepID=A0A0W0R3Y6_9GAMM|nr:type 4a pilus biogenesis protein PilO [Legionella adelaidensis]KTC65780.1 Tfp pilus assembly protein PilO [Legionella adelaidensis]